MPDVAYGSAQTDALKADLVAAVVQRELIEGSKVAPRCLNVSQFCVPGAKTIDFPKAGSLTVVNRVEGTAGDAAALTYGVDTLPLSFNAYVSWIVDYKSQVQSSIDVQLDTAARAARAHAAYLDNQIIAELEAAGDATTTTGAISYAVVLEMMETFLSREGRQESATLLVGPAVWAQLMNINEFKSAEIYGGQAMIPTGVVGRIHGVEVVMSSKVAATRYYLFDREAIAYGLQAGPSYSEQGANEFGSQAKRAVLDQIFGVKAMLINQGGAGVGESALIIKDANV